MKKKPSGHKPSPRRRTNAKGRTVAKAAGNHPPSGDIHNAAVSTLARAHKLHNKVDEVHAQANELHDSIHRIRLSVSKTHGELVSQPPETADIVLEEARTRKGSSFPIVGIGASAGGFEAFNDFLSQLPKDLGMALVLVQHLDPKHKSKLTELLGRATSLPVIEATNDKEVKPDCVYVIPENTTMTINGGRLRLTPRKEFDGPPMPIDTFFRSLA